MRRGEGLRRYQFVSGCTLVEIAVDRIVLDFFHELNIFWPRLSSDAMPVTVTDKQTFLEISSFAVSEIGTSSCSTEDFTETALRMSRNGISSSIFRKGNSGNGQDLKGRLRLLYFSKDHLTIERG